MMALFVLRFICAIILGNGTTILSQHHSKKPSTVKTKHHHPAKVSNIIDEKLSTPTVNQHSKSSRIKKTQHSVNISSIIEGKSPSTIRTNQHSENVSNIVDGKSPSQKKLEGRSIVVDGHYFGGCAGHCISFGCVFGNL